MQEYISILKRGSIPWRSPGMKDFNTEYRFGIPVNTRRSVTSMGIWALVALDWVTKLAWTKQLKGKKILEIMGGTGVLSKALLETELCAEVVCTDDASWGKDMHPNYRTFMKVENLTAKNAIKKYADFDVVVCSWPPYNKPYAADALKTWNKTWVHIGEGPWGCTADNNFFDLFEEEDAITIPQWSGIHDYAAIGRRGK